MKWMTEIYEFENLKFKENSTRSQSPKTHSMNQYNLQQNLSSFFHTFHTLLFGMMKIFSSL